MLQFLLVEFKQRVTAVCTFPQRVCFPGDIVITKQVMARWVGDLLFKGVEYPGMAVAEADFTPDDYYQQIGIT